MARKTKYVKITKEGRDKDKLFLLTEMPALQTERWATRAFLALAHAGVDIPEELRGSGIEGLAVMGIQALTNLRYDDLAPLLDEMLECVQIARDPAHAEVVSGIFPDTDFEEPATILELRAEIFSLHTGFSWADVRSKLTSASAITTDSLNTKTSLETSGP